MGLVTSDWKIDVLIAITTVFIALYWKIRSIYSYFEKRNIEYVKPKFLLGSDPDGVLFKVHISESWDRIYKKLENRKYGGFYNAILPMLMVRDPEYVTDVLKTSFQHFPDRNILVDEKTNPLDVNLFFVRGNKWRYLRSKMAPLFSQLKLKWMYEEIERCTDIFEECFEQFTDGKDVEMKDILARYTTDVIATCGLGIEPQSIKNPNSEFRQIGRDFFDPKKINMFLVFLRFAIPRLLLKFKIKTVSRSVRDFFLTTTKNILHQRKSMGIVRKDFVQLLLELEEKGTVDLDYTGPEESEEVKLSSNEKLEFSDNLLAAQSFAFFLAGFETTSTGLHFIFYLLAQNKEIQERARNEVKEVKAKYGKFTFDSLKELKYLANCIAETLRLYPPLAFIIRECAKDYTLPDGVVIEKGLNILIPTLSLHRDPKYFPEPMKFNPDRFENPPASGTYMPFGDGPRICIGKRFAEAVMCSFIARALEKYEFDLSPTNKHGDYVKLNPQVLTSSSHDGLFLRIHKINGSK